MRRQAENKDWSDDGMVFFCGGFGWGLTKNLTTIPLGKEDAVRHYLETGELKTQLSPLQVEVLTGIKEIIGETDGTGESDMERRGTGRVAGYKQKATTTNTPRKRLTLRASH